MENSLRRSALLLLLALMAATACTPLTPPTPPLPLAFTQQVLVTGLDQPWEIAYGPDDYLWVTERTGKRVIRVNPADGEITPLLAVEEALQTGIHDGLLGMALHPELLTGTGNDYVYIAYTYKPASGGADARRTKVVRYAYDAATAQLGDAVDLLVDLPASTDHNGGRLLFGPDEKLYYAIGDQGANNLENFCLPNRAQTLPTAAEVAAEDWQHYVGKILRVNLDGSIPGDNPTWDGVQSHVYTLGHRNVQGLAAGLGQLYGTEHGPKTDDEVNRLVAGQNYGWPYVAGAQDDQAYVYANWSASSRPCAQLEFNDYAIPTTVPQQPEGAWSGPALTPPLLTFGTVANDYDFQPAACDPNFYLCWPTVAPTGLALYPAGDDAIPDWENSLLMAALKTGTIYRIGLTDDGSAINGTPQPNFKTTNRYRDLAIAPDGRTFYVITDSQGGTQDPTGLPTYTLENPGAILVFTYEEDRGE